jgi:hypothetical protein
LKVLGIVAITLLALALLFPFLILRWFVFKSNHSKTIKGKAFNSYMASLLYMHQLGYKRKNLTALQLAEKQIDPAFNTNFAAFIKAYQKLKYSNHEPTDTEYKILTGHYAYFVKKVRKKVPFGKRLGAFLKTGETLEFFTQPNILGSTKNTDIWSNI